MSQQKFIDKARAAIEDFDTTHRNRRSFSPTQFPSHMSETDWWEMLLRHVADRAAALRFPAASSAVARETPAQRAVVGSPRVAVRRR